MLDPPNGRRWPDVNAFVEAYESAQARDGCADLAEFAPPAEHPNRLAILCELVRVDLEHQWDNGQGRRLEHYRDQLPELFADSGLVLAMATEEYRLRLDSGEHPTPSDYRRRFGLDECDWPAEDTGRGSPLPGRIEPEHADFIRDLSRTDPHAAGRMTEALADLPAVGTEFFGFRLCAELGRGAFGRVYLARQGDMANRLVALKVSADVAGETHMLAQLQHTNIVPVYSVHRSGLLQAVCMPFLGATTLSDTLQDLRSQATMPDSGAALLRSVRSRKSLASGPSEPVSDGSTETDIPEITVAPHAERLRGLGYVTAVLWLFARVADGLAHAHERGILHRDLKPANILFADDGEPLLLDFNLAADTKLHIRASAAMVGGTLPYMAPEHLEAFRDGKAAVDARSDVYSLGVILHELLTGRHPFPVRRGAMDDVLQAMISDRSGAPSLARRAAPSVSPAVWSIVARCLTADPAARYESARALQEDLQRQLEDRPLKHAREPSPRERIRKWCRRHPRLSSSTALGVLAVVLIAAVVAGYAQRQRRFGPVEAAHALRQLADGQEVAGILLLDPSADPARRAEGIAACRKAIERYAVLDSPGWLQSSLVVNLPAEAQSELRDRVGDVLMLWAGALGRQAAGLETAERSALLRDALRRNALAESCYAKGEVPRSCWVQRAKLARLANDPAAAARADARATRTPVRSPKEYARLSLDDSPGATPRDILPALAEASRRDPQDFALWMYLGQCHALQGHLAEAEDCFTVAVVLRPGSPWPYFHRGRVAIERKEYVPAILDFDRVLSLRPDLSAAHVNRALAKMGQSDHARAVDDLTAALDLGAPETRIYFLRSEARKRSGDAAGAERDRAEGLRRSPADPESWVSRGLARVADDPTGAVADFDQALRLDPGARSALQNKASTLSERLGRTQDAVVELDRAVSLYPDFVPARVGRGVLLARLGRREEAIRDAEDSRKRDASGDTTYRAACVYALTSNGHPADRAMAVRLLSIALGQDAAWIEIARSDPDLAAIRDDPGFRNLLRGLSDESGAAISNE
jgi:eukaryotic-like serine/threonine-protein kinase